MQTKKTQKIIIAIIVTLAIIMTSSVSLAGITPSQITGQDNIEGLDLSVINNITDLIRTIGIFISIGALMIIGAKYLMGSIEEKANYKKTMMPYIIGCFILFGASALAPQIEETFTNLGSDTETIGNTVLGLIQAVGSLLSVGVLMVLGIKYMMGSAEERAEYKRSMLPYIIGVVLIFAAVNITKMVYDFSIDSLPSDGPKDKVNSEDGGPTGTKAGQTYINVMTSGYETGDAKKKAEIKETVKKQYDTLITEMNNADKAGDTYNYWFNYEYAKQLENWLKGK